MHSPSLFSSGILYSSHWDTLQQGRENLSGDAKSIPLDEQYPLHWDVWELFSLPRSHRAWDEHRPNNQQPGESITLYQTRPSSPFPPSPLYTPKDLDLHRRGRTTSQEEVMMFMMSLNVDSSQATKSLSVVAISCRRAFREGGCSYIRLWWPPRHIFLPHFPSNLYLMVAVLVLVLSCEGQPSQSLHRCNIRHKCQKKAAICIILISSAAADRCFRTK